jgi:hypothetical protein
MLGPLVTGRLLNTGIQDQAFALEAATETLDRLAGTVSTTNAKLARSVN